MDDLEQDSCRGLQSGMRRKRPSEEDKEGSGGNKIEWFLGNTWSKEDWATICVIIVMMQVENKKIIEGLHHDSKDCFKKLRSTNNSTVLRE
jgi:hypothetical protein